jgi:hypothetical protein
MKPEMEDRSRADPPKSDWLPAGSLITMETIRNRNSSGHFGSFSTEMVKAEVRTCPLRLR